MFQNIFSYLVFNFLFVNNLISIALFYKEESHQRVVQSILRGHKINFKSSLVHNTAFKQ